MECAGFMIQVAECYRCKRVDYTDPHEVFYGRGRRKVSIKHGMVIRLCRDCHRFVHEHPKDEFSVKLKKDHQRKFEEARTREEFMKIFGRSYL